MPAPGDLRAISCTPIRSHAPAPTPHPIHTRQTSWHFCGQCASAQRDEPVHHGKPPARRRITVGPAGQDGSFRIAVGIQCQFGKQPGVAIIGQDQVRVELAKYCSQGDFKSPKRFQVENVVHPTIPDPDLLRRAERWVYVGAEFQDPQRDWFRVEFPGGVRCFNRVDTIPSIVNSAAPQEPDPCPGSKTQREWNVCIVVIQIGNWRESSAKMLGRLFGLETVAASTVRSPVKRSRRVSRASF